MGKEATCLRSCFCLHLYFATV